MNMQETFLSLSLKPKEISGTDEVKEKRINEILHWFERYANGKENRKLLVGQAFELAHYINESKKLKGE